VKRLTVHAAASVAAPLVVAASLAVAIPSAQGSVPAREAKAPTLASMLLTVAQIPTGSPASSQPTPPGQ
jgi:hypothetical protein